MNDNWVVSTLEDALRNWNDKLACVCKRNSDGNRRGVIRLTVRRILKTKGMRFSLQTYHVPDILWIENTGGGSMQIRASTTLRNEYLQISQLAKVSGEPIYITNKGEADLVVQSIEAYEQREKMLAHRASVLEAELDRLSGAPTYSPEQVRGRMKEIFDAARVSD